MVSLPESRRPSVAVVPVATPEADHVDAAVAGVENAFGLDAPVGPGVPAPVVDEGPNGVAFAEAVREAGGADVAVGVTDEELRTDADGPVFGVALPDWNVVLVSTPRLAWAEGPVGPRVEKVVAKNLGRVFGLADHDRSERVACLARPAALDLDVDDLPTSFCDDHAALLESPETAPAPPEWFVDGARGGGTEALAESRLGRWYRNRATVREWVDARPPATRRVLHGAVGTARFYWRFVKFGFVLALALLVVALSLDPYESLVGPAGAGFLVGGGLVAFAGALVFVWTVEALLRGVSLGLHAALTGEDVEYDLEG